MIRQLAFIALVGGLGALAGWGIGMAERWMSPETVAAEKAEAADWHRALCIQPRYRHLEQCKDFVE